jgi:malate permease and related proteins
MNFLLIGICLAAGMGIRASGTLPENAHKGINSWILYIALPAVAFHYIPAITWSRDLIFPVAMPFLVWIAAWVALKLLARHFPLDTETHAALLLTAGLGNTSFIGFPLTQAYFGDEGLRIAVIYDQINFILLATLGVMTALKAAHGPGSAKRIILRSIFRFPPLLASLAALIVPRFIGMEPLNPLLDRLSATLVPLSLFSVGLQIRFSEWRKEVRPLSLGLAYKLLMAPALVLGATLGFQIKGIIPQVSVFESAMPPMITSAIMAAEYQLNPRVANLMVSAGILLSLPITALWWLVLRALL